MIPTYNVAITGPLVVYNVCVYGQGGGGGGGGNRSLSRVGEGGNDHACNKLMYTRLPQGCHQLAIFTWMGVYVCTCAHSTFPFYRYLNEPETDKI